MAGRAGRSGAKPGGQKTGGRKVGTPNRATVEMTLEAEHAITEARTKGRKLGKEMLWDIAELLLGMAAVYQPNHPNIPKGDPRSNVHADEDKFRFYIRNAADVARYLADFQSPKFKAIAVVPAPDEFPNSFPQLKPSGKAIGALEAYQQLRDKDMIDVTPDRAAGQPNPAPVVAMPVRKKANGGANGHG